MTVLAICLASAARPVRWPGRGGEARALPGGEAGALPGGVAAWRGRGLLWLLALARRRGRGLLWLLALARRWLGAGRSPAWPVQAAQAEAERRHEDQVTGGHRDQGLAVRRGQREDPVRCHGRFRPGAGSASRG